MPHMLDFLARQGEVAIVGREGRHRRWDLAERVHPKGLPEYDEEEAARLLAERRLQALGIAKQKSPWSQVGEAGELATVLEHFGKEDLTVARGGIREGTLLALDEREGI